MARSAAGDVTAILPTGHHPETADSLATGSG
jgi:hypothetical protein